MIRCVMNSQENESIMIWVPANENVDFVGGERVADLKLVDPVQDDR